jgi:hypothetical protein
LILLSFLAQGKARRAERAVQAERAKQNFGRPTCNHFSFSPLCIDAEDKIVCMALASKYGDRIVSLLQRKRTADEDADEHQMINDELFDITTDTYAEFRHFPDRRKEVFRDILVSKATFDILSKANAATDLIKESKKIAPQSYLIILLAHIEIMEKYEGEYVNGAVRGDNDCVYNDCDVEFLNLVGDLSHCPRSVVRFVNKRNSCSCLEKIYSELKKNTKRTNKCFKCGTERYYKEISAQNAGC